MLLSSESEEESLSIEMSMPMSTRILSSASALSPKGGAVRITSQEEQPAKSESGFGAHGVEKVGLMLLSRIAQQKGLVP